MASPTVACPDVMIILEYNQSKAGTEWKINWFLKKGKFVIHILGHKVFFNCQIECALIQSDTKILWSSSYPEGSNILDYLHRDSHQ